MWNVMAADDEAYIREALQKLIDWKRMDCTLSKVVCDGQELLDLMQEGYPDIIITDIQMPLVNGLEICKFVYEYCPETQVILLTAYSDFEYAKMAVKYSACEYVLKISIMEELPEAVNKAIEKLEKSRREIEKTEREEPGTLYLQLEQYIEQNFNSKISLDDIAEALHANRSYLSRLYKSKKGINLFDAILDRRIEAAKEYLMNTDMKTYEICGAVGIEDAGYFSKMFKKKTGFSPKDYRKKENNGKI